MAMGYVFDPQTDYTSYSISELEFEARRLTVHLKELEALRQACLDILTQKRGQNQGQIVATEGVDARLSAGIGDV